MRCEQLKYVIRSEFGAVAITGAISGAYWLGLRRGNFLVGCSCAVMRGTVPGVLYLVVQRWVRSLSCSVALDVGFVEDVTGGARLTL